MKLIFILLFTFGEMYFIGFNRMLGNMAKSDNHDTERSWPSQAHFPQWKDQTDTLDSNRNKWKTRPRQTIELIKLIKLMENHDYLSILYKTF